MRKLLEAIEFYSPVYANGKDGERLRMYAKVIAEDASFVVEFVIKEIIEKNGGAE